MAEPEFISLIHLIQHPEKFHEKLVRVIGVGVFRFERKAVYVTRDDLKHAVTKNAVWVEVELTDEIKNLHEKYVIVEGVFDKDHHGHLKLYSGALVNVQRLDHWGSADEQAGQ